jgi:ADP-ribosylglycohydrolase
VIEEVYADLHRKKQLSVQDVAERYFLDKTENIVALAISLALVTESAEETAPFAPNLGVDADSVASIGGAIAGALRPETVNDDWFRVVSAISEENVAGAAA